MFLQCNDAQHKHTIRGKDFLSGAIILTKFCVKLLCAELTFTLIISTSLPTIQHPIACFAGLIMLYNSIFNIYIHFIPGKGNVVAYILSCIILINESALSKGERKLILRDSISKEIVFVDDRFLLIVSFPYYHWMSPKPALRVFDSQNETDELLRHIEIILIPTLTKFMMTRNNLLCLTKDNKETQWKVALTKTIIHSNVNWRNTMFCCSFPKAFLPLFKQDTTTLTLVCTQDNLLTTNANELSYWFWTWFHTKSRHCRNPQEDHAINHLCPWSPANPPREIEFHTLT